MRKETHTPSGASGLGGQFNWLWASSGFSNTGDGITRTLLPLLAVATYPEPAAIAGLTVANMLPWLLFALPVGVLVDRVDRRKVMITSNLVRAGMLLAALVMLTDNAPILILYGLAFVLGVAETVVDIAASAMLPGIVNTRDLHRANGRLTAIQISLNEMLGPPIAGFLFGVTASVALVVGGTAYAVAAVLLVGLVRASMHVKGRDQGMSSTTIASKSIWQGVRTGLRFVLTHRALRLTLAASTLYGFVFSATLSMLVLLCLNTLRLDSRGYGLLLMVGSVGAIVGSWLAPRMANRLTTATLARWSLVACGTGYIGLGLSENVVQAGAWIFVNGVLTMLWNIPVISLRQRLTPTDLLGRVMSVSRLCSWGSMPLGAMFGGLLAQITSVQTVFVVLGCALSAGALVLLAPLRAELAAASAVSPS